jgi:hypothetical protein
MRILGTILLLFASLGQAQPKCGVERWSVKTLADADAAKISPTVEDTQIEILRTLRAPRNLTAKLDFRRPPVEFKRFRVHAMLTGFKQETDSDFHLVLASPNNDTVTMIAEIPAGACVPVGIAKQESSLQMWVIKNFGHPVRRGRMVKLHPPRAVIVEGVGFFDIKHSTPQIGVAPNGIEIHPVTNITLGK